jgi:hypothetical protein
MTLPDDTIAGGSAGNDASGRNACARTFGRLRESIEAELFGVII